MSIDVNLRLRAEQATESLWRKFSDPLYRRRIEDYIQKVLSLELKCADSDPDEPHRLPDIDKQGGMLVLLVGFAIDPLLQSICAYKPSQLVLMLNVQYSQYSNMTGNEFGRYITEFLPILTSSKLIDNEISENKGNLEFVVLDEDQPTHVFHKLRKVLIPRLQKHERLVLDITGGKKSMVAGAFLFGAFADVDISYVDFDEYDLDRRVPRGYTCRIGLLQNPYNIFRLRDWEHVKELYNRYAFHNAGDLLKEILPSMNKWFTDEEIKTTKTLCNAMTMYELWDNGDHSGAFEVYQQIYSGFRNKSNLRFPTAILELGKDKYWPHGTDAGKLLEQLEILESEESDQSFYRNTSKLLVYAYDELSKIKQLIKYNEDYRSALLRAFGLSEVLLRARFLVLIYCGKMEIAVAPEGKRSPIYQCWKTSNVDDQWRQNIIKRVIKYESVYRLKNALQYSSDGGSDEQRRTKLNWNKDQTPDRKGREFWLRRTSDAPLLTRDVLMSESERELRNKAIHTYLSVPRSVAENTLKILRSSVSDFANNWAVLIENEKVDALTECMPWAEMCDACGIDFLPL